VFNNRCGIKLDILDATMHYLYNLISKFNYVYTILWNLTKIQ